MDPNADSSPDHFLLTLPYKMVQGKEILVDIYVPKSNPACRDRLASVVYFHGGGLTVGNRKAWIPFWLLRRMHPAGIVFISPDVRLIPPGTAHDILEDIIDLFKFLSTQANDLIVRLDPHTLAVVGTSGGSLCAYLAAMHASPKPKALLSMYGLGGNFFVSKTVSPPYHGPNACEAHVLTNTFGRTLYT
ncbi:alpha/beta-hydrolase [Heliocybe sulcata]|uniref:Alpha/beta-hydrolase n=1 Tax=Heliocybe sulcata TaxID=5364 RepID=A0A5C3N4J0_9AGAM|nr:alpha/beta-hydrolase [Heliocybe sulcata]